MPEQDFCIAILNFILLESRFCVLKNEKNQINIVQEKMILYIQSVKTTKYNYELFIKPEKI